MSVKIIIADDHDAMRDAQRTVLESDSDFEIVGEACDGAEAIRLAGELRPDIVIMDINMPDVDGVGATCRLHQSHPNVKVIGFSLHATEPVILSMLYAGAAGYVSKSCPQGELTRAIKAVLQGKTYVSSPNEGLSADEILPAESGTDTQSLPFSG